MVSQKMLDPLIDYTLRYIYSPRKVEENRITRAYGEIFMSVARELAERRGKRIRCKICGKVFRASSHVARHYRRMHIEEIKYRLIESLEKRGDK